MPSDFTAAGYDALFDFFSGAIDVDPRADKTYVRKPPKPKPKTNHQIQNRQGHQRKRKLVDEQRLPH